MTRADTPVAVVVCTRDRPAFLEQALPAVGAALRAQDEAVVIDSASRDPAVRRVAEEAGFRVVRCEEPGLARARNAGAAATEAAIVGFTDDDCRPAPDWTAVAAHAFEGDSELAFVSGRVVADREDGPVVAVKLDTEPRRVQGVADPTGVGHGADMFFRRVALEAIGGFDERLGTGTPLRAGEDIDAFYRLLRKGWAGAYDPRLVVTHVQWRTPAQVLRLRYGYGIGAGAVAMKAIRLDGKLLPLRGPLGPGWRMLADRLWDGGLLVSARAVRNGHRAGIPGGVLRAAGAAAGAARAALLPIDAGHFRSPNHQKS